MSITAKSVIFDIADNHGNTGNIALRSVDFWNGGSKIDLGVSDFAAYATSEYSDIFEVENVFDTSLSKTGGATTEWISSSSVVSNQRLIIVFNTEQTFDEIKVNNSHFEGTITNRGVNNVVINTSTDSITNTTYNAAITNATKIFDGVFDEHTASDVEDEQNITLLEPPPVYSTTAKSVIFDIANNWGYYGQIGIRSIDFWNGGSKIANVDANGDYTAYATYYGGTSYHPKYAFDTTLSKTGSINYTSWIATNTDDSIRLICVFTEETDFDEIRVNNIHISGSYTTLGVKDVVINVSTDEITNITYNAAITNATKIFDGQFDQHISADTEDEQILTLDIPAPVFVVESPEVILATSFICDVIGDSYISLNMPEVIVTTGFSSDIRKIPYYKLSSPEVIVTTDFESLLKYITLYRVSSPEVVVTTEFFSDFDYTLKIISPEVVVTSTFNCSIVSYSLKDTAHYYYFTLTGDPDGLDDIDIPIENFQCRRRSGDPTFLTVTIPTYDYADEIAARPNGKLRVDIVYKRYGQIVQRRKLVQTNFDGLMSHQGTKSSSIMLQGYVTETYVPKTLDINTSMYRSVNFGTIRHRLAKPIPSLNPGDTVNIGTDTFVANVISFYIAPHTQTMEVAEE